MKTAAFEKKRHPLGFYQASPLPAPEELARFYHEKYYQEGHGHYEEAYSDEEKRYLSNAPAAAERIWESCRGSAPKTGRMLDVGCGQGFIAAYFLRAGWKVEAMDFSSHGVEKHHPELKPYFTAGNVYDQLEKKIASGRTYDLINLSHVLEHVLEPLGLLDRIKRLLGGASLLRVAVPNDFSAVQERLTSRGLTGETWFVPPEHLNYFTFASLAAVLADRGFETLKMLADFPIELFLFNEHSNYWKDRSKGKAAHRARIEVDNLLFSRGVDAYIDYMASAAACDFGRNIAAFARLKGGR